MELEDEQKPPVLRAYLKRWKAEVGVFFDGVGPDSSEEELLGRGLQAPGVPAGLRRPTDRPTRARHIAAVAAPASLPRS